jgi:hypothetical protein
MINQPGIQVKGVVEAAVKAFFSANQTGTQGISTVQERSDDGSLLHPRRLICWRELLYDVVSVKQCVGVVDLEMRLTY